MKIKYQLEVLLIQSIKFPQNSEVFCIKFIIAVILELCHFRASIHPDLSDFDMQVLLMC